MAVIRILSTNKTIPYNPKSASMYANAIKSGQAILEGDIPEPIEVKKKVVTEGSAEVVADETETYKPSVGLLTTEYDKLTIKQLREIAKEEGISATGSKAELVERLSNI
jgi:tRNA(Glu) U13 pseudouridine synthase TruD